MAGKKSVKRSNDALTEHLTAALDQARPAALALPPDAQSAEPRELSPFSEVSNGQQPVRRARQARRHSEGDARLPLGGVRLREEALGEAAPPRLE